MKHLKQLVTFFLFINLIFVYVLNYINVNEKKL